MNDYEDIYLVPATEEEGDFIDDKLMKFNVSCVPFTQKINPLFIRYVIKNEKGEILGGINAALYHWNILYIDNFWLHESIRNKGYGSQLLKKVEEKAKENNCTLIHLDTFDFQAKDFYLKHAYEVFGVLDNCPKSHQRIYLKKNLNYNKNIFKNDTIIKPVNIIKKENDNRKINNIENFKITEGTKSEIEYIDDKLTKSISKYIPFTQQVDKIFIRYVIKNNKNEVLGGINADLYYWNILYIDSIWLLESIRNKGFGMQLLKKVEEKAKENNCTLIHLDTFDFQAKDFYLKHGYEVFGVLDDCPSGHKRFYLKKVL